MSNISIRQNMAQQIIIHDVNVTECEYHSLNKFGHSLCDLENNPIVRSQSRMCEQNPICPYKVRYDLIEFEDDNGEKCSLQKSSSAFEDKIWLGIDEAKILEFYPMPRDTNESWFEISKEEVEEKLKHRPQNEIHYRNQRMHLSRELVKELLPHLQKFVETGDI